MILTEDDFIENNDEDAMEYGWTLNLEDDEEMDEVIQALKLKELVEERMKLYDDISGHECGLTKQETNEFMVLEQLLEDSKK